MKPESISFTKKRKSPPIEKGNIKGSIDKSFATIFNKQVDDKTRNVGSFSSFGSSRNISVALPRVSIQPKESVGLFKLKRLVKFETSRSPFSKKRGNEDDILKSLINERKSRRYVPQKSETIRIESEFSKLSISNRRISEKPPVIVINDSIKVFHKDEVQTPSLPKSEKILRLSNNRINNDDVMTIINSISKRNQKNVGGPDKKKVFRFDRPVMTKEGSDEGTEKTDTTRSSYSGSQKMYKRGDNRLHFMKTEERVSVHLFDFHFNQSTFKKANSLRYRENVFRAASRLTTEMPPFPDWSFQNQNISELSLTKINVGGQIFCIFDSTLANLINSKLATCMYSHSSRGIPFFDRDYICFNAILNFYRTGRLHVPPNTCLTLFEEELEFWGVSEQFMEPCCWTEFRSYKIASNKLKKYAEDLDKDVDFHNFDESTFLKFRIRLYKIMTSGTGNVYSRWVSMIVAFFILLSILGMILASTPYGRMDISSGHFTEYKVNETVSSFLGRTKVLSIMELQELLISGFFLAELIFRVILCPNRWELFSDTLNWVDLLATMTSLLSNIFTKDQSSGNYEGYMLLLKLPRIFRLFKLTSNLRSGMDAFTLTVRASANELRLIFLLLFIMTAVFGSLIFVVEMVNESHEASKKSAITNIYFGMWYAIVTMATVGFGDFVPNTTAGYLIGSLTIMIGVILCQMPVPIVLKNFTVYTNQASARLNHKSKFSVPCTDPESKPRIYSLPRETVKINSNKKFEKIFSLRR